MLLERNQRNIRAGTAPSFEIPGGSAKQERITSLEAALAEALAKVCGTDIVRVDSSLRHRICFDVVLMYCCDDGI